MKGVIAGHLGPTVPDCISCRARRMRARWVTRSRARQGAAIQGGNVICYCFTAVAGTPVNITGHLNATAFAYGTRAR